MPCIELPTRGTLILPKIQMEVIPEPAAKSAAVLQLAKPNYILINPFALITGVGETDYICGACRVVLAARAERGQFVNLVFKCLNCGSFNVIRGS